EGVIAKRRDSLYVSRRSRDWLKIKCQLEHGFVIGGYTVPQGARAHFGALHLGLYENSELVYVSEVGTGFGDKTLALVVEKLRPLARSTSPFARRSPTGRGHHWVEPRLVCEVRFTEWTRDGGIRQPAFLGLRDDKRPEECTRESPVAAPAAGAGRGASGGAAGDGGDGAARGPAPRWRRWVGRRPRAFPRRRRASRLRRSRSHACPRLAALEIPDR